MLGETFSKYHHRERKQILLYCEHLQVRGALEQLRRLLQDASKRVIQATALLSCRAASGATH